MLSIQSPPLRINTGQNMRKLSLIFVFVPALLVACTVESQPGEAEPGSDATIVAAVVGTIQSAGDAESQSGATVVAEAVETIQAGDNVRSVVGTALAESLAAIPTNTPLPPTATPAPTAMPPPPTPTPRPTATPSPTATAVPTPTPEPPPAELTIEQIIEEIGDSVVRIETELGSGSGVIVQTEEDGTAYLLTNNHVVDLAEVIEVTVRDTDTYVGTVFVEDLVRDLAIVEICCDELAEPLLFADQVSVGSDVVALGYPLGVQSLRVSSGVVSGKQTNAFRSRVEVQTDAAINPGNSGGPLVGRDGSVAGLNTFVVRGSSGQVSVEGIGFAISAETLKQVVPQMLLGRFSFSAPPLASHPSLVDGAYQNEKWYYLLDVPPGWTPIEVNPDAVAIVPLRSDIAITVTTIATSDGESGGSINGFRQQFTLEPQANWQNFNISQEGQIQRSFTTPDGAFSYPPVFGWEFLYRYDIGSRGFVGITQWFFVRFKNQPHILVFTLLVPEKIWLSSDFDERVEARQLLNSLRFVR